MWNTRWLEEEEDDNDAFGLISTIVANLFLFGLIFGLSATVEIRNLRHQFSNKFALLTGVAMQFFIMPLLGFIAVVSLQRVGFGETMGLTLLVVTSSPGGSYSNWFCALFNAELALSVAMTAVSTILAIGMLPANLLLYSHLAYNKSSSNSDESDKTSNVVGALDFGALFISLGVVIGAIVGGLYTSYVVDPRNLKFRQWALRLGNLCGISLILVSVIVANVGNDDGSSMWSQPWDFYVAVAFPCVAGLILASTISFGLRLAPPECMAIAIECCYQNAGIGVSVAITMFDDPSERAQAVSVPLYYGVCQTVVIFIYCLVAWKLGWSKAPTSEKICTVLTTSYEIKGEGEEQESFADRDEEEGDDRAVEEEQDQEGEAVKPVAVKKEQATSTARDDKLEDTARSPAELERIEEEEQSWYKFWLWGKPKSMDDGRFTMGTATTLPREKGRSMSEDVPLTTGTKEKGRSMSEDTPLTEACSPPQTPEGKLSTSAAIAEDNDLPRL